MVNENITSWGVKLAMAAFGAIVSAQLRALYPILVVLVSIMAADYYTGVAAAKYEKLKSPNDPTKGLSSKVGWMGILKKSMYGIAVLVGLVVDYLIIHLANELGVQFPSQTFFGLLTAIWLILNDILSIIENSVRMDVSMPPFLKGVASALKIKTEEKGNINHSELDEDFTPPGGDE